MGGDLGGAWSLYRDARRARRRGPAGLEDRRRSRLAELVTYAREHSPYYRALYADVPEHVADPASLPVTSKRELMDHFDEWVTDRTVTWAAVSELLGDPARIGELLGGRYLVVTTSGTSGTRGVFVLDERYWAVATAMMPMILQRWLRGRELWRIVARGGRFAQLIATGGHYMSFAANRRAQRERPRSSSRLRVLSVHRPVEELVPELNRFDPGLMWGYASVVSLLADRQAEGALRIRPGLVICAAEGLPVGEYSRIAEAFDAKVRNLYGGTESGYAAYGCAEGWLHTLGDWVILEPVDERYRPVPPGVASHTVLLTNLANRVQPILRYDLGDSILVRPDACPCGDRAPAIRVQGRASDVLTFPGDEGAVVRVAPLVIGSLMDRVDGVSEFQVVQEQPAVLRVRMTVAPGADADSVWSAVRSELTAVLDRAGAAAVAVERADEAPERSPGGKLRTVVPYAGDRA